MPRDAHSAAKAVDTLDLLIEFFDDGQRWIKGKLEDGAGNRCLVGALRDIRDGHNLHLDSAPIPLIGQTQDRGICRRIGSAQLGGFPIFPRSLRTQRFDPTRSDPSPLARSLERHGPGIAIDGNEQPPWIDGDPSFIVHRLQRRCPAILADEEVCTMRWSGNPASEDLLKEFGATIRCMSRAGPPGDVSSQEKVRRRTRYSRRHTEGGPRNGFTNTHTPPRS
jgi:hypothetical protein